jgi:hypothetical protein
MFSPVGNFMFSAVPIFIGIVFIVVISIFIFGIGSSLKQYSSNKAKPVETLPARVIAKRPHTWGGAGDASAHTSYYVTFELENGDRIEMPVNDNFYGMNVEGDTGMLTHQGTRMMSFERAII